MKSPSGYEKKFAGLIKSISKLEKGDFLIVDHPEVLGDNYEELVESLRRIANAEVRLTIVPEHFPRQKGRASRNGS